MRTRDVICGSGILGGLHWSYSYHSNTVIFPNARRFLRGEEKYFSVCVCVGRILYCLLVLDISSRHSLVDGGELVKERCSLLSICAYSPGFITYHSCSISCAIQSSPSCVYCNPFLGLMGK